ncbi:hypothetical protein GCM10022293_04800 [Azospirillum formosense]
MPANWVPGLRAVATIYRAIVALNNSLNFLAAQAAVATILQRCQDLVAQVTKGSTEALAFPAVDKLLLSTPNVVQTFVYDTRLDDLTADGRRWNEPGRCSHLSYWHEAQGVYRGVKRDFPAVALIVALREQWYIYDALDQDPVTGTPRLWAASNPTGNGLIYCGPTGPITSVHARNGYLYFGVGTGLHVVSLTGDWCERYDNGGRRRRLGTFAQRNTLLAEGGVTASAALPANGVNSVHAHVYPGAPLDAAGMPVPTIAVGLDTTAAVIHPNGQVVTITGFNNPVTHITLLPEARVLCTGVYYSTVEALKLPYASADRSALLAEQYYYPSYGAAPDRLLLPASEGITRLVAHNGGIACNFGGRGLLQVHRDPAAPHNGMLAHTSGGFCTGWMPGDTRLATLCDATVGAITGSELFPDGSFSGGSAAGWNGNGAAASVVSGALRIATTAAFGRCTFPLATVSGQSCLVRLDVLGTSSAPAYVQVGTAPFGVDLKAAQVFAAGSAGNLVEFTATGATSYLTIGASYGGAVANVDVDNLSCRPSSADRSYKGKGVAIYGTLQRNPVAAGSDVVAWSGFSVNNYVEQRYNADLDFGTGDFAVVGWFRCDDGTAGLTRTVLERSNVELGAGFLIQNSSTDTFQVRISDGTNTANLTTTAAFRGAGLFQGLLVRRGATLEAWVNGALAGTVTASAVGSVSNAAAITRVGSRVAGSNPAAACDIALLRACAYAPTPAQIRKMYEDERPLFAEGAKCLLGGISNAVTALSRDPLTGRLAAGSGDGVSIFQGLRRVSYLDEAALAATTSDTVRSVALRGGSLLIGTAAEVGFVADAIGGKEAIAVGGPRPVGAGFVVRGVTTDGAALDLAPRVPVGERETVMVEARVIGRVVGAADTERLTYVRRATYYRDAGGAITLQGSVQTGGTDTEVTGSADATLATVGDWVSARVTGVSGKRIRWEVTFTVTRISEENSYAA